MSELLSLLKDFDLSNILPEMGTALRQLTGWLRLILLAPGLTLTVLGVWYTYGPPDEANFSAGYRTKWSMASVPAWRYAQKLAGRTYLRLGIFLGVVMLVVSLFFGIMEPVIMAVTTLLCTIAQMVVVVLAHVQVDKRLHRKFDQSGDPRK